MKIFDASTAIEMSRKAKQQGINYQIKFVLDAIKYRSSIGQNQYVLDLPPYVFLNDSDYNTLEKLGFTVLKPTTELSWGGMQHTKFGVVTW